MRTLIQISGLVLLWVMRYLTLGINISDAGVEPVCHIAGQQLDISQPCAQRKARQEKGKGRHCPMASSLLN